MKRGGRLNPISKKRAGQLTERAEVRAVVLDRDRVCQGAQVAPEIPCGFWPARPGLEIDEIRGGSYRSTEWLDPDRCWALCPVHHDDKTDSKARYVAAFEARIPARTWNQQGDKT